MQGGDTGEGTKPVRSAHLAIIALVLLVLSFAWLFYLSDVLLLDHIKAKWPAWFGVSWFEAPDWQAVAVAFAVGMVPMFIFFVLSLVFFHRFSNANFTSLHQANLRELGKAKTALQQSLVSIALIEQEYRGKLQSFEQLQSKLAELQAVRDIDTEDLRKKLSAIAAANRYAIWFERGLAFLSGVAASLMATYIWERFR